MPREKMPSHRTRISHARTVALQAIVDAAALRTDPSVSRSTATRAYYKHKAEALDRVLRILNGKERR